MLKHPTLEKLYAMKLFGMAKVFKEQIGQPEADGLSFEDRFALLVDREVNERENRRLRIRLKNAKFKMSACAEDIDYRSPRGLDKALLMRLFACDWINSSQNVLVVGPTDPAT
jgi:DNA replication protein DnaC